MENKNIELVSIDTIFGDFYYKDELGNYMHYKSKTEGLVEITKEEFDAHIKSLRKK